MFGYVRAYKPMLRVCEYELYDAVYCGLCGTLRRRYGLAAACALSYDLTFLALLHMSLNGTKICTEKRHCPVHPLKRKLCVCCNGGKNTELEYAADCQVILTYNKLLDDLSDRKILSKLRAASLLPFAMAYYHKAKKYRSGLAAAVSRSMKNQRKAERSGTRSLDRLSEPTAAMMRAVFCELGGYDPDLRDELGRFGYMLGRFVYICDAIDDLEEDICRGDVNPFVPKKGGTPREKAAEKAETAVHLTLGELSRIYAGLPSHNFKNITDNIVYLGLPKSFQAAEKPKNTKV